MFSLGLIVFDALLRRVFFAVSLLSHRITKSREASLLFKVTQVYTESSLKTLLS